MGWKQEDSGGDSLTISEQTGLLQKGLQKHSMEVQDTALFRVQYVLRCQHKECIAPKPVLNLQFETL